MIEVDGYSIEGFLKVKCTGSVNKLRAEFAVLLFSLLKRGVFGDCYSEANENLTNIGSIISNASFDEDLDEDEFISRVLTTALKTDSDLEIKRLEEVLEKLKKGEMTKEDFEDVIKILASNKGGE